MKINFDIFKPHLINNGIRTQKTSNTNNVPSFSKAPVSNPIACVPVSFLGNNFLEPLSDFDRTVKYNYFKLPKVTVDGEQYQVKPDKGQVDAAKSIYDGDTTILEASTGAGKTALAHYAINKNLYDDKKTIITVPLISLANDKYREFSRIYGQENVGLLTGVNKVNTDAPITIMVTEILRNQAATLNEHADEIGTIVFDEAHYIGDEDRGAVWENSMIAAAKSNIQMLCLSATLGNGEDFANWLAFLNPQRNVSRVTMNLDDRFVPLSYSVYNQEGGEFVPIVKGQVDLSAIDEQNLSDKQKRALAELYCAQNNKNEFYELTNQEYISTLRNLKIKTNGDENFFYEYQFKDELVEKFPKLNNNQAEKITQLLMQDKWVDRVKVPPCEGDNFPLLVDDLRREDKLPALIFKLSQKGCDNIQDDLYSSGLDLTTREEKEQIKEIIDRYLDEGASFGEDFNKGALLKGFGVHHAGKLPAYQELVEELFSKKLIKVVSATSTLSAGINMPVRTVVMTDVSYMKYNPKTKQAEKTSISPSDFHQMTGRAGRRGIDPVGYVVLYNLNSKAKKPQHKNPNSTAPNNLKFAYDLIGTKPAPLESNFKPEPCMIAQYYYENNSNDNLEDFVGNSFKVFLAKNPQGKTKDIVNSFKNYTNVLKNLGFLTKEGDKTVLSPKGELLRNSMGANPLMVSSLVYEQKLKNLSAEQLAQIAGYISSADAQKEDKDLNLVVSQKLSQAVRKEPDAKELTDDFRAASSLYRKKEESLTKAMVNNGFNPDNIETSDSFSGLCTYLFAHLNSLDDDSKGNFDYLVNDVLRALPHEKRSLQIHDFSNDARIEFNRKATSGKIFKTIAQSISVLEQIQRVCEQALSNEEQFENQEYYLELKQTAAQALSLIKKEPFSEGIANEN